MVAPPLRIDMHAHFYGGGLPAMLRARGSRPCLRPVADGTGEEMLAMNGAFPFGADHHDHRVGLARMAKDGLTARLLTFPGALGLDVLPAAEVAGPIARFNDHLAALGHQTGSALRGLAGLPLADMTLARAEVFRIRRELGLPGVILPGNYFASLAEARQMTPVLEAANATGAHVMIHPGLKVGQEPPAPPADHPQYRTSAVALQSQIADTALTLVLSDILDAFPRISFQIVNLGGTLPFILERIEAIARHRNAEAPFPTGRLKRIWYDCASLGPRAIEAAVAVFGADRLFLGSDFPIFHDDPYAAALAPARLSEAHRAAIAGGSAAALFARLDADRG